MHALSLLAWHDTESKPAKLIRLLGRQKYTHVALQVGPAISHVGVGNRARWTSRSSLEQVMGPPDLDLSLGYAEVNVTELHGLLTEACPHSPTIQKGLWYWLTLREIPGSCVQTTRHLLAAFGQPVPDKLKTPDALVRHLHDSRISGNAHHPPRVHDDC